MRAASLVVLAVAAASCATTFVGNPKVPQGAAGCRNICASYGMELTGMVALGEYSDGCICELPGRRASAGAGSAGAATAAVMADMRRRAQQDSTASHQPARPY